MIKGKRKAVTFSYDDGVTQDQRLIEIFDKYDLKATFNLNSGLLGKPGSLIREDVTVAHVKPRPCEIADIYKNHEVAAHTLTHPMLPEQSDKEIIRQVEEDRYTLSELVGYEVVGMAYPGGGVNYNAHVAEVIRNHTGIKYARTTVSTHAFGRQSNLLEFKPTVYHHTEWDMMTELWNRFIETETDEDMIFYIWGHAYEFDINHSWGEFEKFCKMISHHPDVYYGTNREVLL